MSWEFPSSQIASSETAPEPRHSLGPIQGLFITIARKDTFNFRLVSST